MIETINIGNKIRELRKIKGLSQTGLANILSTTQDTISLWELGKSLPDIVSLKILCEYFEVSADFMLGLEDI